jgi:hypothetical protein
MVDERKPHEKEPVQGLRYLLCDPEGRFEESALLEAESVSSPIRCFDRAVDGGPRIIVIHFSPMPIGNRDALVELAAALKRNRHTRQCPILALIHMKHRKLLEDLSQARVDFARWIADGAPSPSRLQEIIDGLGPADRLERHLSQVCPFLHYSPVDACHELTLCGAYLDRMVLGGTSLHETCETENHLGCEYFQNPRSEL